MASPAPVSSGGARIEADGWYWAYGRRLRSALRLPELPPGASGEPAWHVRELLEPPRLDGAPSGSELLYDQVRATLFRAADGWTIRVDDTGTFAWCRSSRTFSCWRAPGATEDFLRAHLIGRVMATALHDEGMMVLHAAGITVAELAYGLVGEKGAGKTTLSLALARAGAALLTDDTLPVEPGANGSPAVAWPGVTSVRVHADTQSLTGAVPQSAPREDGKRVAGPPPGTRVASRPAELRGIGVLVPVASIAGGHAVAVAPLSQPRAVAALLGHGKISAMLGAGAAAELLRRATQIVRTVPVRRVMVVRDLARLDKVAAELLGLMREGWA